MFLLKDGIFCLRVVLSVFISNRHVVPVLQTVPGRVILYFCFPNYVYYMYHCDTQPAYTCAHAHCILTNLSFRAVIEDAGTDTNIPTTHNHVRTFLLQLLVRLNYHCPSALLFIKKSINEDLIDHSLVSLERSRETDHLPIPVLKLSSIFNSAFGGRV